MLIIEIALGIVLGFFLLATAEYWLPWVLGLLALGVLAIFGYWWVVEQPAQQRREWVRTTASGISTPDNLSGYAWQQTHYNQLRSAGLSGEEAFDQVSADWFTKTNSLLPADEGHDYWERGYLGSLGRASSQRDGAPTAGMIGLGVGAALAGAVLAWLYFRSGRVRGSA